MAPSDSHNNTALLIIEFGMAAMAFILSFGWPGIGNGVFDRVENFFAGLARRRGLAVFTVGVSACLVRIALLPLFPVPLPFVPDDFSFLLSADTFAHGRLTNPTPAMWTHFETIHETMRPTYQSMYFPGQGLMLATGQVLFGHPWFAVLATVALMCATFTWMLQAWVPPSWALLGGFIAVIRLGLFTLWINSYHTAGALAALGGALMLGGLPRLIKTARMRYGLLMGIGIAILGLTRPYEGLLLGIPTAVALGRWVWKGTNRPPAVVLARRAVLPLTVVFAAAAWLGYYDHAAFGKATTLPYTVDHATYGAPPYFIWQKPAPAPHYRHDFMRVFYQKAGDRQWYNALHSVKGFVPYTLLKILLTGIFYTGFLLVLPLAIGWRAVLDRRIRYVVLCVVILAAGASIEIYLLPQYVAALAAAFYAIGIQAMRHVWQWKPEGRPVGRALVRLTVFFCVALAGIRAFAKPLGIELWEFPPTDWIFTWSGPPHFGVQRAQVEHRLSQFPGGQLAIVRYGPDHPSLDQWVYNSANIARSKVIWAGEMGPDQDQELLKYYHDRTAWLVEPDADPVRVIPYPKQTSLAAKRQQWSARP